MVSRSIDCFPAPGRFAAHCCTQANGFFCGCLGGGTLNAMIGSLNGIEQTRLRRCPDWMRQRLGGFGSVFDVAQNPFHDRRVFDAGDDLDGAAVVVTSFDIDLEHVINPKQTLKYLHLEGPERIVSTHPSVSASGVGLGAQKRRLGSTKSGSSRRSVAIITSDLWQRIAQHIVDLDPPCPFHIFIPVLRI